MSGPRAVGVRIPYGQVPQQARTWVDEVLGSPVVSTSEQVGGMSPGNATRVVCADGTRAFVKGVGKELNPLSPAIYRREATVLGMLGRHELWAGLVASYDVDGWVVLEDVDGVHFGGALAWRAHTAVDVNLPTLHDFRIMESRRLLGAASRRLGLS